MSVVIQPISKWCFGAERVAMRMRAVDRAEVWELGANTPEEALRSAIAVSSEAYLGLYKGTPAAVFGVLTQSVGLIGSPWLLGTDTVTEQAKELMAMSRRFTEHLRKTHHMLQNVVHDANAPSKVYLRRLGFKLTEPHKTASGATARTFYMEGYADV